MRARKARTRKQVLDVAQAADAAVQKVLAVAVAVEAPGDGDGLARREVERQAARTPVTLVLSARLRRRAGLGGGRAVRISRRSDLGGRRLFVRRRARARVRGVEERGGGGRGGGVPVGRGCRRRTISEGRVRCDGCVRASGGRGHFRFGVGPSRRRRLGGQLRREALFDGLGLVVEFFERRVYVVNVRLLLHGLVAHHVEHDLGHARGQAVLRPLEDDVLHLAAAQVLHLLLA